MRMGLPSALRNLAPWALEVWHLFAYAFDPLLKPENCIWEPGNSCTTAYINDKEGNERKSTLRERPHLRDAFYFTGNGMNSRGIKSSVFTLTKLSCQPRSLSRPSELQKRHKGRICVDRGTEIWDSRVLIHNLFWDLKRSVWGNFSKDFQREFRGK